MTLKELLELGIREDIITEEQPVLQRPIPFRSFSAKVNFFFAEEELKNPAYIDVKAESFLMHRTSAAGGDIGCRIVWKSEELERESVETKTNS